MSKISEIINGWGNVIKAEFNVLPPDIMKMSEERLLICHDCPIRFHSICNPMESGINVKTGEIAHGCGCALAAKTMSTDVDTKCPLGKW